MLVGMVGFFAKFYIAVLIFRYILTQQEMNFNPFGRIISKATESIFSVFNRPKSFTDKFIPLLILLISTLYALFYGIFSGRGGIFILNFLLGYQDIIEYLTMFFICCIILGAFASPTSGSFPLYFYRLGNLFIKPVKKLIPIKNNFIIIPAFIFIFAIYGALICILEYIAVKYIGAEFKFSISIITNYLMLFVTIAEYYKYVILIRIIMSWVSPDPRSSVVQFLYYVTEPLLAPLRKIIPPLGFIDLSPIVAFFIIYIFQRLIQYISFNILGVF